MNNVLELKGKKFTQERKRNSISLPSMNGHKDVTAEHLERLNTQLQQIQAFWKKESRPFSGLLISVYYNKIAAKSNRISGLFKGEDSNFSIVGSKFNDEKNKHIITYLLSDQDLEKSIDWLSESIKVLLTHFSGSINKEVFDNKVTFEKIDYREYKVSKSRFRKIIADASYIEKFAVEYSKVQSNHGLITLYDTGKDTKKLLESLGINILSSRILDNNTVFLDENQLELLMEKSPYLVAMATEDLSDFTSEDFFTKEKFDIVQIPNPTTEPTIGVIDTLFDERVYFNNWVEYHDMVDSNIEKRSTDYSHGTAVSSIIVDGPRLNPWLDDGCGRFRVRHFGVATGSKFSSFSITKIIKRIVSENRDIKVWNISLGSNKEINDNFISAEAAILDTIQYENDVIFVIAGTNKPSLAVEKIGSPADSINSLVVNAVTKSGISTNYTRKGLALSFFAKPDVSYYGGSQEKYIRVCEPLGEANVAGTSFAAPWIARKLSYLIDILGLKRELAKALIIDSARGWNEKPAIEEVAIYGHGIVPIRIEDILSTPEDEIRFLVSDVSEKWNTYNYEFPIPYIFDKDTKKYPYITRATMCYFPTCNRSQGIDYTNTELDLHFGRVYKDSKGKIKINEIDDNKQNQEDTSHFIPESLARSEYQKWNNIKYKSEKTKVRYKKYYPDMMWGMEVKTSNRLDPKDGVGLRFAVVITIKDIKGVNRIDDFIKNFQLAGWLVNQIDIQARVELNRTINEPIEFD